MRWIIVSVCNLVFCCAGEYQECLRAGISTALARLRDYDLDTREGLSQELAQTAEFLDQAARLAMAAMLQVKRSDGVAVIGLADVLMRTAGVHGKNCRNNKQLV